jgi:hypothetical protein
VREIWTVGYETGLKSSLRTIIISNAISIETYKNRSLCNTNNKHSVSHPETETQIAFENRVSRRISEPKGWRKAHNEEHRNLYFSPNVSE